MKHIWRFFLWLFTRATEREVGDTWFIGSITILILPLIIYSLDSIFKLIGKEFYSLYFVGIPFWIIWSGLLMGAKMSAITRRR